ncbi:ABC transporter ATP-binding protein [Rothia nasimurium]|uniref:ABC transporter ATP-binding protein n=1 Tax=Rothia nasimurium TaxID=85336 RepID=A0A4Y9F225_9MICC|nr:ABC transporter ATP-binding protein [Rothia nasimurium]MBF0808667.1 ABC transporter ATP-binding protein [Rothia nasimurium]TFU21579.1 ABC transporter ATP-binding protein [Rothia nasimurium]
MTRLEAQNITVVIRERKIIQEVSLSAMPGQITALTGISGSGKSTLLATLGLLVTPISGKVTIDGHNTSPWPEKKRAQFWAQKAAFIYQDYGTLTDETVGANVTLSDRDFKRNRQTVEEALTQVGLKGRSLEPATVLSGGEKQRLGIARALYKRADVLYADEPTASLDHHNSQLIYDLLRKRADAGATVLVATHDDWLISRCDAVYQLP